MGLTRARTRPICVNTAPLLSLALPDGLSGGACPGVPPVRAFSVTPQPQTINNHDLGGGGGGDDASLNAIGDMNVSEADTTNQRKSLDKDAALFEDVQKLMEAPAGEMPHVDFQLQATNLILACCKGGSIEALRKSRGILNRLVEEKRYVNEKNPETPMVIPASTFHVVLFRWAKLASKYNDARRQIRLVLGQMVGEAERDEETLRGNDDERATSSRPTVETFNGVLRAYVHAARFFSQTATEAEELLVEMTELHESKGWNTKPDTQSYTDVILAYANAGGPRAGTDATRILEEMKKAHQVEKERYKSLGEENSSETRSIVSPDCRAYTGAIKAHIEGSNNNKESAEKATSLLMELARLDSIVPDALAFGVTISAWAQLAAKYGDPKLRFHAAERAEELALQLLDLIEKEQLVVVESKKSQDNRRDGRVEIAVNSAINAWAKSDVQDAPLRAEALLHRMMQIESVKPTTRAFNTVLNAWARSAKRDKEAPQRAEEMLAFMNELHSWGESHMGPDAYSYATVMNAWANSNDPLKAREAKRLFDTMLEKHNGGESNVQPRTVMYSTMLDAAASSPPVADQSSDGDTEELGGGEGTGHDPYAQAVECYKEILTDKLGLGIIPNHITFAAMLKVIKTHTDRKSNERLQMVERVFEDARRNGQVSAQVVRALHHASPSKAVMARLLGRKELVDLIYSVEQLPKSWSQFVPRQEKSFHVPGRNKRKGKQARSSGSS